MLSIEKSLKTALGLVLATTLAGCSGEGNELPSLQPDAGSDAPKADGGLLPEPDADITPAPDAPTVMANAGPDQSAQTGAEVTLSGTGRDSSGGAISYVWTQIAGPTLRLETPDQPIATFTAPLVSAQLEFQLAVRSANGFDTDTVEITIGAAPALFVANRQGSVVRYAIEPGLDGDVAPEATWTGARARVRGPSGLAVDKMGGLLVTNADSNRVSGFSSAFGPGGDVIPERYVGGPALPLNEPEALAYDRTGDLLFVSNFDAPGTINVWSDVSSAAFTGEVQPVARLQSMDIANTRDLELLPNGDLYVLSAGLSNLTVFAKASTSTGEVKPARTIQSDAFIDGTLQDAFIDAGDQLYVVGSQRNEILVFENASSLDGTVAPARTITLTTSLGASGFAGITLDPTGTAYVSDVGADAFYVIEGIATKDGAAVPDRTVTGAKTGLASPGRISVVVP